MRVLIIKVLMENRGLTDEFLTEHGLSLYIEVGGRKILFDTGETSKFIDNAKKLDVNLSDVDLAVVSHGHYDHGGGASSFLKENNSARVYFHSDAFVPHASNKDCELEEAGVSKELLSDPRIVLVDEDIYFDEDLILFSSIKGERLIPEGNKHLLMNKTGNWEEDDFLHEQNLIIIEGNKRVLVSGCSHRGILNIVERANQLLKMPVTHVIGGFHLYDINLDDSADLEFLNDIAREFEKSGAKFYTGHCTGYDQFKWLKEKLGNKIDYIPAGTVLEI